MPSRKQKVVSSSSSSSSSDSDSDDLMESEEEEIVEKKRKRAAVVKKASKLKQKEVKNGNNESNNINWNKNGNDDSIRSCSSSLIPILSQLMIGPNRTHKSLTNQTCIDVVSSSVVSNLSTTQTYNAFHQRVTAMRWHPKNPSILISGSKHGEIFCYDDRKPPVQDEYSLIDSGSGPGGALMEVRFDERDENNYFTCTFNGNINQRDLTHFTNMSLVVSDQWRDAYLSMDINFDKNLILTARLLGNVTMIPLGQSQSDIKDIKLHKTARINHVEMHPKDSNIFATASTDRTVKIWDLRNLKQALNLLTHDRGVSSSCFNSNGSRLLTTDQGEQLRVYSTSTWQLESIITHHHRCYQYLTLLKASWHPLCDLIVAGNYPPINDKVTPKTIDFYDGSTGKTVLNLRPTFNNDRLFRLNYFNNSGDILASATGSIIYILKRKQEEELDITKLNNDNDNPSSKDDKFNKMTLKKPKDKNAKKKSATTTETSNKRNYKK